MISCVSSVPLAQPNTKALEVTASTIALENIGALLAGLNRSHRTLALRPPTDRALLVVCDVPESRAFLITIVDACEHRLTTHLARNSCEADCDARAENAAVPQDDVLLATLCNTWT